MGPLTAEDIKRVASEIAMDSQTLREYSRALKQSDPVLVFGLARELFGQHGERWLACEILRKYALESISEEEVEEFGYGINSWGSVDQFARGLSGPAWLNGRISDGLIHKWAESEDRWWRRAALVSTVALNIRSHGGMGDTPRTLAVCSLLADDPDDMVVKALSWALRALVVHDREAVGNFLSEYDDILAARVKREVRNKLTTGLKNPRRKK